MAPTVIFVVTCMFLVLTTSTLVLASSVRLITAHAAPSVPALTFYTGLAPHIEANLLSLQKIRYKALPADPITIGNEIVFLQGTNVFSTADFAL